MIEVPVTFKLDHLWALNDLIRHESDQTRTWSFPPSNLELNEKIAEAILICEESQNPDKSYSIYEYTLMLTRGDTFCIDYNVRASMKSPGGNPIGKAILLAIFKARRTLSGGWDSIAQESPKKDVESLMERWKEQHAVPDADTDNYPDDQSV